MKFNDNQKLQILLAELAERYDASHKIRERTTQFTLWISGLAIGLAWVLIDQGQLELFQKIALTGLIFALTIAAFTFLWALRKGAASNRKTTVQVEQALGMYEKGVYLDEDRLLPEQYQDTRGRWSDLSFTNLTLLLVTAFSLTILTWACPSGSDDSLSTGQIKGTKKGEVHGKPAQ